MFDFEIAAFQPVSDPLAGKVHDHLVAAILVGRDVPRQFGFVRVPV
jgi:hypothetical protein